VIGPRGTKALMSNLERAYAADIEIRIADEKLNPTGVATLVEEYETDRVVYQVGDLTIRAFEVDDGEFIKPAHGYHLANQNRVVVVSGDTRSNENVVKYASGADLLIHEVAIAKPELMREPHIQRIMAHHTTAREAGAVFA